MRSLLTLLICCVSISISLAQSKQAKPAIMIGDVTIEDNTYYERELSNKTATLLKKNYYVSTSAPLQLDIVATPGEATTINGMDTYTISQVEVAYTISLKGLQPESKTISVKVKGSNEGDLQRKIGTTISRDKTIRTELMTFIDEYVASMFSSCADVSAVIDQQLTNDPESAFASIPYYNLFDDCAEIAQEKEKAILDAICAKVCQAKVQAAEILANGATIIDLTKATDKLLTVSADSPCQEDVFRISKLISANAKELETQSGNDIIIRLDQTQYQSQKEWRQSYRQQYYRNRRN